MEKFIWKDKYEFIEIINIIYNEIILSVPAIIFIFFYFSLGLDIIATLFININNFAELIIFFVVFSAFNIILVLSFWAVIISIRSLSYIYLSQKLEVFEDYIFLGKDETILKSIDKYVYKNPCEVQKWPKTLISRLFEYPFFEATNLESVRVYYNEIKEVDIQKEKILRAFTRKKMKSKLNTVFFITIIDDNGRCYKKQINNYKSFKKEGCLDFLKKKVGDNLIKEKLDD